MTPNKLHALLLKVMSSESFYNINKRNNAFSFWRRLKVQWRWSYGFMEDWHGMFMYFEKKEIW